MTGQVPDTPGPIIGWRYWRASDWKLLSAQVSTTVIWSPTGVIAARCNRYYGPSHAVPDPSCGCGFHAFKHKTSLTGSARSRLRNDPHRIVAHRGSVVVSPVAWRDDMVVGQVALSGKVNEYDGRHMTDDAAHPGYRAAYARPVSLLRLWSVDEDDRFADIAGRYRIPIVDDPGWRADLDAQHINWQDHVAEWHARQNARREQVACWLTADAPVMWFPEGVLEVREVPREQRHHEPGRKKAWRIPSRLVDVEHIDGTVDQFVQNADGRWSFVGGGSPAL